MKGVQELKKTLLINEVDIEDYSFGADRQEEEQQNPENPEEPTATDENGEPTDAGTEAEAGAEAEAGTPTDTPEPTPAPAEVTIDDADTSSVQIVISLYSVYDMQKPNTDE